MLPMCVTPRCLVVLPRSPRFLLYGVCSIPPQW